jgi:ABC-type polysaccharide/polyol phosphate export permease
MPRSGIEIRREFMMKDNVSPPVLIAIIVGVVLVLGLIGWKVFGSNSDRTDPKQDAITRARKVEKG